MMPIRYAILSILALCFPASLHAEVFKGEILSTSGDGS